MTKRTKTKKVKKLISNEPSINTSAKVSTVVKIASSVAAVYTSIVALYLILKLIFHIDIPESIVGFSSNTILIIIQIFIFATTMTFATKFFLISPVNQIKTTMKKVSNGDLSARAAVATSDELGELARNFNDMLENLTYLKKDKKKTENELTNMREELKYKNRLEKREHVLKKTNKALETLVKDFALLYEVGQSVNSTIEMSELYNVIQDILPKRFTLDKFTILIIDENREFLNVRAAYGFEESEKIFDLSFRVGEGISGDVVMTGEPIYVKNADKEPRFLHYRGETINHGSFVSLPLKFHKDIVGVMNCSRRMKNSFTEEEMRLLTLVANQIALAVENAKLYTKTRELSVKDELTNLYNRRHFQYVMQMEWKRATRFKHPISVLMIDIDHFKTFNDAYGHLHGDKVLKMISSLLLKNIREVDTLARFGGEEFVALLPDTDKEGAIVVGEKLRRLVESEKFEKEHEGMVPVTISVGISNFPSDAREFDDLIDHADLALYEAKDKGRNRVEVYGEQSNFSYTGTNRIRAVTN